jgi:hypothetical protein
MPALPRPPCPTARLAAQLRAAELEEALAHLQADQTELNNRQAELEAEITQLAAMADASALIGRPRAAASSLLARGSSRGSLLASPLGRPASSESGARSGSRLTSARG